MRSICLIKQIKVLQVSALVTMNKPFKN